MASRLKYPRKRRRFDWVLFRCNATLICYALASAAIGFVLFAPLVGRIFR